MPEVYFCWLMRILFFQDKVYNICSSSFSSHWLLFFTRPFIHWQSIIHILLYSNKGLEDEMETRFWMWMEDLIIIFSVLVTILDVQWFIIYSFRCSVILQCFTIYTSRCSMIIQCFTCYSSRCSIIIQYFTSYSSRCSMNLQF